MLIAFLFLLSQKHLSTHSIRARFGADGTRNAGHGSDSQASAQREIRFFFPNSEFPSRSLLVLTHFFLCVLFMSVYHLSDNKETLGCLSTFPRCV